MASSGKGNRRRRSRKDPSWYDKSVAALSADQEEVMEIPIEKVGLVIGTRGWRLQEIRDQTGIQITIKAGNQAHLRGTAEQLQEAKKIIEEVVNPNVCGLQSRSNRGGFKVLQNLLIPEHLIGHVIGKGRVNFNSIETKTGVGLKVIHNKIHIKGASEKEEKLAIREIKALASVAMKRSQLAWTFTKVAHVDTAQLKESHEFQLSVAQPSNASLGEIYYKLKLLEDPLPEETFSSFTNTGRLTEKILNVLKKIHGEKDEDEVKVDMWCHFGHGYITNVDEDELEETFTLEELKEKIEITGKETWKPFFEDGVKEMEVEAIEEYLPSQATKEDIRHDFSFSTPSCRNVRVKAWLIEDDAAEGGSEAAAPMTFSRNAPVPVKNVLTRVQPDEQGDASNTPCFHICSQFHNRLKVDILIPSKGLDCRLSIRTSCKNYVPKTLQDEEEDKTLESYLMGMKIDKDRLTLPPASKLQDGFDFYYQRRSLRKTYQYEMNGEQFSLTVCKDQATNVDPCDPDASNIKDIPAKTDIHFHCDEWDRVLDEGNWEPEQIVAKLPAFLQFIRQVQRHVSP